MTAAASLLRNRRAPRSSLAALCAFACGASVLLFVLNAGDDSLLPASRLHDGESSSRATTTTTEDHGRGTAGAAAWGEGNDCASRRGARGGRWEQDLIAAPRMQYARPAAERVILGEADKYHVPDPNDPIKTRYRSPSTYVWRDGGTTEEECGGPVAPLSGEAFCAQMLRLGMERILFVGDSLSLYHSIALLNQIGADNPPWRHEGVRMNEHWEVTFDCGNEATGPKPVKLERVQNFYLVEKRSPLLPAAMRSEDREKLMPWTQYYLRDPSRTLLVVNTGSHYSGSGKIVPPYEQVVDAFFNDVRDRFQRPDDLVVFRTTPRGHASCMTATRPFASELEFENEKIPRDFQESYKKYGWDFFEKMNDHAREAVSRYNDQGGAGGSGSGPAKVYLLDVVPMTSLRPDGHISSPDNRNPKRKKGDCLHYSLPGPMDWYNNLLFANLADLPAVTPAVASA